jgi:hypothetical protein
MKIIVDYTLLMHKSGTKFYQILQFSSEFAYIQTLVNCGTVPSSMLGDKMLLPIICGRSTLYDGAKMMDKAEAKTERGYSVQESFTRAYERGDSWFSKNLGKSCAKEVDSAMFRGKTKELSPGIEVDNLSIEAAIEAKVSIPDVRPAGWGAW